MVAEEDRGVTRLVLQGTYTQRLMGITPSSRRARISGVRIDRLEEGRIVESWFHWNSLGMLEQIGALPALDRRPAKVPDAAGTARADPALTGRRRPGCRGGAVLSEP